MTRARALRAGSAWPDGEHGEVVSPSGVRSYLAGDAARLSNRTARWVAKAAADGVFEAERGHVHGQRGGEAWFVDAASFEEVGRAQGWWPPAGSEFEDLQAEVAMLRGNQAKLLRIIQELAGLAGAEHSVKSLLDP